MTDLLGFALRAGAVALLIVLAVVLITLFFRALPDRAATAGPPRVAEPFDPDARYELWLSSGERLSGLRFEGVVEAGPGDAGWGLRGMAAFRAPDGGRVLVRADAVRVAREEPPT